MTGTTLTTRDVRAQLADLRGQRRTAEDTLAEARTTFSDEGTQTALSQVTRAQNALDSIRSQITDLEEQQRGVLGRIVRNGGIGENVAGLGGGSLAERFRDPGYAAEMRALASSTAAIPPGSLRLADVQPHEVAAWTGRLLAESNGNGAAGLTTVSPDVGLGAIVQLPTRQARFLDVVPSRVLDQSGTVEYIREVAGDGGPAPVELMQIKPAIGLDFEDAEAVPTTIAGWTKVSRLWLSDFDQLDAAIRGRLMALTGLALETEVLSGDGTVSDRTGKPGLVGLLNTTGLGEVQAAGDSGPEWLQAILQGRVTVEASGGQANFAALNLQDWATLMATTTSGSGEFLAPPFAFGAGALTVWGMTLTAAVGIPEGTAIVGDSRAMTLLISEPAQVLAGTESDDFIRNRLTLLCEVRAALAVWAPTLLCLVKLGES